MKPLKLTLGSDPELIIVDERGSPCSALRILKNTKEDPIDLGDGIKVYADNVMMEASFTPVRMMDIVDRIRQVLLRMKVALGKYDILPKAAIMFPAKELRHKLALEIGCSDNFGAYRPANDCVNPKLKFTDGLRTGSFHIHIGNEDWETGEDPRLMEWDSKIEAIKLLDLYLGVSSIIFDNDSTAHERRKLYGKAGEFRPTKYGIEYRVLGNYSLCCPKLVGMVFKLVKLAMHHISYGTGREILKSFKEKDIVYTINENNSTAAEQIVRELALPSDLEHDIMSYVPKTTSIATNWGF